MAGDWIKMRSALRSSPKVVRIASALRADGRPDRLRVVGALHAVWSLADEHSADGKLDGYTLDSLDDEIGWPGFSAAMQAVDWLSVTPQGIEVPRFDEHNGTSAKRRAMESERKRRGRMESGQKSAPHADKKRTREEKRRVKNPVVPLNFPEGIEQQDWQAFRDHRSANRKKLTPRAEELALAKLHHLAAQGYDPKKLLNHAIEAGWATFYEREECRTSTPTAQPKSGPCECGVIGMVKVGGKWRCEAHIRGMEAAA